jgi:predicted metal-binding membrane protein
MAGPRMKPRPKAAPMSPIPRARSSGPVTSAMTAWAVETLAPMTPPTILARSSPEREF